MIATFMFIRFVIQAADPRSDRRQGLFQAAVKLRDSGRLSAEDDARLERIWAWFNKNLQKPSRLAASSRHHAKPQAISWFRDTAAAHIAKMREFQVILERYGFAVEMIKSRRLGYILYEDDHQIVAYPFSDTPK